MKIADILSNHIVPFETEDMKLKSLFSFFLHLAPTISSSSAGDIPKAGLARTLASFLRETRIQNDSFRFYTSGSINKSNSSVIPYPVLRRCHGKASVSSAAENLLTNANELFAKTFAQFNCPQQRVSIE